MRKAPPQHAERPGRSFGKCPPIVNSTPVHPFRIYTMQVEGETHVRAFAHPEGVTGHALDCVLHERFQSWLDLAFPEHAEKRRVSKIAFTDRFRPARAAGAFPVARRRMSSVDDPREMEPVRE